MSAPERIWMTGEDHGASWSGSFRAFRCSSLDHSNDDGPNPDYPEYIRKDASDAGIAAARAEGVPSKEAIYALALRMWAVHPKDLDAAGYDHVSRGGKYENPRAAWYADQIEALCRAAAEAQP